MKGQKRKLDVYLRAHSGGNVHAGERVVSFGSEELIEGCVYSLLRSLEVAEAHTDVFLTVIDDHSPQSSISILKKLLEESHLSYRFLSVALEGTGAGSSFRAALETSRDLLYLVEDTYLHSPSSVSEIVKAYEEFTQQLGGSEVAIFPVDNPKFYDRLLEETRIVPGPERHFRTVTSSTGTLLLSKKLLTSEWDTFAAFALSGVVGEANEDTTINRIWREGRAFLFAPIPTLAIPMLFVSDLPPFTDWRKWWRLYAHTS